MAKLSQAQFIATLAPMAVRARIEGSPLFPSVRLAQNLLETGGVIHPWNNLGGIKVGSGKPNAYWHGQWVQKGTWEVENGVRTDTSALFRAYDSVYDFYKDQDLLFQLPRYDRVRQALTPNRQAEALRLCGYATDPQYDAKLISIIQANKLTQYDEQAKPNEEPATPATPATYPIIVNGVQVAEGQLFDGQIWVPARVVGNKLQIQVGWKDKAVTANGNPLATRVVGTDGYVPVRDLAASNASAKVKWNKEDKKVDITLA
ncbi:glucosaminidase domain-containing protein [Cohnella mopanensis]|uniref:glucosaminidase domain-containing protein n=1 Tax=Cohnella mopanensis TaxID=2911966 RepID=UPI001EF758E9|nr:glucosaminidase domain-containing protein [Cohnella mopanensis]